MRPLNLLPLAALLLPLAAQAQTPAEPPSRPASKSATAMCGVEVDAATGEKILHLATCLKYCPTPAGYQGCRDGRTGKANTADQRGGFFDEQLACNAYLGNAGKLGSAVASVDGVKWNSANCPNEHGAAAEVVFARAKDNPSLYLAGLTIMQKGKVRGERFAPLLYQSLAVADPRIKALSLSLLRRNFINADKPEDRVVPPDTVMIPLMYDADPLVSATAVTATADRIQQSRRMGAERVAEALSLLGPVAGPNDSFNPLPAGVNAASPSARKTAIEEIGRLMSTSDRESRHRVLRHIMRLNCEEGAVHKAAFELYYKILTPDVDFLRTEKKQKGGDGPLLSREDLWADQLYQALYGAGDVASSKNENKNGAHYSRNCIGPIRN